MMIDPNVTSAEDFCINYLRKQNAEMNNTDNTTNANNTGKNKKNYCPRKRAFSRK